MKQLPLIFSNIDKSSNLNFTKIENLDVNDKFIIKIKLTNSCCFDCDYCFFHYKDSFIKLETIQTLLREIKRLKKSNILFVLHGGEPTLHPKFYDIVNILSKYGAVNVLSNMGIPIDFNRLPKCFFMFTLHTQYKSKRNVLKNLKRIKTLPKDRYDLVLLMSKNNFKDIKNLYSIFKMMYNVSIGYVFQDIPEIPNEYLNLFNDNVIKVSHDDDFEILSYQAMIKKGYINFHGCNCNSGNKTFILNSDGIVYRCEAELLNKNPMCNIKDLHNKIFKDPIKCASYWCTEYWSTISNDR